MYDIQKKTFNSKDLIRCYKETVPRRWEFIDVYSCEFIRNDILHTLGNFQELNLSKAHGIHVKKEYPIKRMEPYIEFQFEPLEECEHTVHECTITIETKLGYGISFSCSTSCFIKNES